MAQTDVNVKVNIFSPLLSPNYKIIPLYLRPGEDNRIYDMVYHLCERNIALSLSDRKISFKDMTITSLRHPIPIDPVDTLVERIASAAYTKTVPTLAETLENNPSWYQTGTVQLILEIATGNPDDEIFIVEKEHMNTVAKAGVGPAPSSIANSVKLIKSEQRTNPLYNGRPYTERAAPVGIYDASLASLKEDLDNLAQTAASNHNTSLVGKLFLASANIYDDEDKRIEAISPLLEPLLGVKFRSAAKKAVVVHVEVKNELGIGGDSSLQAALTYRKYITQKKYEQIRNLTCCPVILISIAGPHLQISAAVLVDIFITQPLTDVSVMGGNPYSQAKINQVAKVFDVVSRSISSLRQFYQTLKFNPDRIASRLLPQPTPRLAIPINNLEFRERLEYTGRQPDDYQRSLFLTTYEDKCVVVKFCENYHEEAHRLLANVRLAPELYLCHRLVGGGYMIIMEYIQGEDAYYRFEGKVLPSTLISDIKRAISILHSVGLVYGDLRRVNIVAIPKIPAEGETSVDSNESAVLIDFDWVGKHGEAKYPSLLNDTGEIDWAEGVSPGGVMRQQHDLEMLDKLNNL